jgi:hypothetical protein
MATGAAIAVVARQVYAPGATQSRIGAGGLAYSLATDLTCGARSPALSAVCGVVVRIHAAIAAVVSPTKTLDDTLGLAADQARGTGIPAAIAIAWVVARIYATAATLSGTQTAILATSTTANLRPRTRDAAIATVSRIVRKVHAAVTTLNGAPHTARAADSLAAQQSSRTAMAATSAIVGIEVKVDTGTATDARSGTLAFATTLLAIVTDITGLSTVAAIG